MTTTPVASITPSRAAATAAAPTAARYGFGDDGFTFGDFLDIINPLQHIPVVGTIYRAITGDTMEAGSEIAGGALYGGPIGVALATTDLAFTESTGKHLDNTMLGWIGLDGSDSTPTAVAHNAPAATLSAAHAAASHAPAAPVAVGAPTAMTSRAFPAATRRIVPMATYAQPLPASPPVPATTMPQRIAPMLTEPSVTAAPEPAPPPATTASDTPPPAAAPAPSTAAAQTPDLQGAQALLAALRDSGVDPASAARAAAAYQASVTPIVRQPATDTTH